MDRGEAVKQHAPSSDAPKPARYYVLALLTLAYMTSYIDRIVLGVLGEEIKRDLGISDTQLGLLTGMSFVLFYGVLGLPVGRLADRYSRRWVLSVCMVTWSLMTSLSGLAGSFWQLLVLRLGVGVGEAGCTPAGQSLLADLFPPRQRAFACAVFGAGSPLGIIAGTLGGGWLAQELGWRAGLVAVGLPGILLALLFLTTVREPPRGTFDSGTALEHAPPLRQALPEFLRNPLFVLVTLGISIATIGLYSISMFAVPFLMRAYDLPLFQAASVFGLSYGISGAIGAAIGGALTDWAGRRDPRWYAGLPAIGYAGGGALMIAALFQPDSRSFTVFFASASLLINVALAPALGVVMSRLPSRLRGSGSAVMLLVVSIFGLGVGPTLTGALSDRLASAAFELPGGYAVSCPAGRIATLGDQARAACEAAAAYGLQHALAIVVASYGLAAIVYLFAVRHAPPPADKVRTDSCQGQLGG